MRRKSLTAEEAEAIIAASGLGAAAGGAGVEAGGAGGASFGGGGAAAAPSLAAPRIRSRRGSSGDVPLPPPAAGDDSLPPVGGALFSAAAAAAAASAGGAEPGARVVPLGPPALAAAALPPPPPAAVRRGLFRSKKRPLPSPPHHHPHFQQHFSSNAIKTAKYNALTFLPRFLFEMFSRAAYLYFLLQAVLSWIPVVSPFGGWGSTLALLFVLLVAAVKALFEDVKRHQQDRATNASRARVVVAKPPSSGSSPSSSTLETRDVEWRDLRVGDVVRVDDGELFPADLVCLHSALEDDVCFIKTTNLDGENNLKIRRPVDVSDAFPPSSSSSSSSTATNDDGYDGDDDASLARPSAWDVLSLRGALTAEAPNANLHVFKGRLALEVPAVAVAEEDGERGKGDGGESAAAATTRAPTASAPAATATGTAATTMMTTTTTTIKTTTKTVPVTINEVLLRGCLLKNTGHVLGLVVYTGRESRIQMNSAATPSKVGSYDHFLNFQIALVMALQLALCVFSAAAGAAWRELAGRRRAHLGMESPSEGNVRSPVLYAGVLFVTFWILYSYLVPISLFVTLEIVKFWQGFVYVNWDEGMRDPATGDYALARNTSLIEDLGKVDYVFSDKTGTLTSNEMQLRQIAVKDTVYGSAEFRLEEWLQQRQQREGGGGGEDGGAAGCGDWRACARAWDPRAAAAAEALTADGSWRSLVAAGGSGRRELALRSSKSEASLALASAASAAASAASEETRGKSRGGGNDEEDGEEVTSSAPPRAPRAPTNGDGADEERDPALLGAHLVDFWTNVCVCHSLIVEPASSSASTPSSPASAATATAAAAATATAAASAASAAAAAAAPSPPLPPSRPVYQGPSPDEVALVEAARAVGYEFVGRSAGGVVLSLLGARVVFEVLAVLEYSSARARMSVVARAPDGTVRLFCKGADARVLGMLRSSTSPVLLAATNRNLRAFAQRGLRTLALATKVIDPSVWADWHARYRAAGSLLDGRDEALALLAEEVERDLELVGVTAIEDKLQEGVPEAIAALLGAGVKVWVITGDKRETATNIAVSCNLVRRPEALLVLDAASREGATAELARAAAELEARGLGPVVAAGDACPAPVPVAASSSTAAASSPSSSNKDNANFGVPAELVIDGATLSHILGDPVLESNLAAVGALCSSVVVCRSSPSQKAGIVRMMREHEAATAGAGKRWRVTRWYARQMRKQSG
jgi:magnesium-transporting ATPase (P-type)